MKRKIILMIGLPCVGKSTYIKEKLGGKENNFILSKDDMRDEVVTRYNLSYEDLFVLPKDSADNNSKYGEIIKVEKPIKYGSDEMEEVEVYSIINQMNKEVNELFNDKIEESLEQKKTIIVDMTNQSIIERENIVNSIRGTIEVEVFNKVFEFEALYLKYDITNMEPLIELAKVRNEELILKYKELGLVYGKPITKETYDYMIEKFEEPTTNELYIDKVIERDMTKIVRWLLDLKTNIPEEIEKSKLGNKR